MDFLPLKSSFQSSAPQTVTLPDRMSNHPMSSGTKHNSSQYGDVFADHVWSNFTCKFQQLKYKKRLKEMTHTNIATLEIHSTDIFLEPSACKVPDEHFHGGMKGAVQRAQPLAASYFKYEFVCVFTVDRIRLCPGLCMCKVLWITCLQFDCKWCLLRHLTSIHLQSRWRDDYSFWNVDLREHRS